MDTVNNKEMAVALDTEMLTVNVGAGVNRQVAGRISVVNENGDVLLDKYCAMPQSWQIVNYNTPVSGLTAEKFVGARQQNEVVQEAYNLMRGKVVVGHDLNADFAAMGRGAPLSIFDTSESVTARQRAGLSVNQKPSLADLARNLLNETIQQGTHNSVEDARAAMKIYLKLTGK